MAQLLERIKDRVAQKDSPIRTVKGVAEAIGMSEAGFYVMIKRGTSKTGTILAIAKSLNVEPSYLLDDLKNDSIPQSKILAEGDLLERIEQKVQDMKQMFEEQLRAKDRQIERLLDLLGKPEGAAEEPLSTAQIEFNKIFNEYRGIALDQTLKTKNPTKRISKVGGTPFSYAENTVTIK
ncbi:hypothetical protein [Spirosoma sp.]|uniref:helix-turn-helix domain-containing protein n=1 Tax=Spirosoma sp. TaxID=1899569 RepID=UPI0026092B1E|nr:hypothetical protein [Spirosoma sp.]MCX6216548.1 hypothetical protein [Spirosoma sp.]